MCYQIPSLPPYGLQEARRQLCLPTSGVVSKFSRDAQKQNGDGKKKLQVRAPRHTELSSLREETHAQRS